jgi:hypothetical protein
MSDGKSCYYTGMLCPHCNSALATDGRIIWCSGSCSFNDFNHERSDDVDGSVENKNMQNM